MKRGVIGHVALWIPDIVVLVLVVLFREHTFVVIFGALFFGMQGLLLLLSLYLRRRRTAQAGDEDVTSAL